MEVSAFRRGIETALVVVTAERFFLLAVVDNPFAGIELSGLFLPVVVGDVAHLLGPLLLFCIEICHASAVGSEIGIPSVEEHILSQAAFKRPVVERNLD